MFALPILPAALSAPEMVPEGAWAAARQTPSSSAGIEVPLRDGGTFRTAGQHGKKVVLSFWASWCSGLSFKIDTFEASIVDGTAADGKRLCTEEEWVTACQGTRAKDDNHNGELADDMIEGTAWPYGDDHDESRCWDGREGDTFRPVYTGEMPGCAFDTTEDHARCYRRNDSFGASYASPRAGFRCCSN